MKMNMKKPSFPSITFNKKFVIPILAFLILFFIPRLNSFWIDYQWFGEVGYQSVFMKNFTFKILVGLGIFFSSFIIAAITLYRTIKSIPDTYIDDDDVIDISMAVKKPSKYTLLSIAGVFSVLITLLFTNALWQQILIFMNQTAFSISDPIFNKDIGYFFFTLPLLETLVSLLLFYSVVIIILNAFVYSFFYRKFSKQPEQLFKKFGIFFVVFFVFLIVNYRIEALNLVYSTRGTVFGAGYTDLLVAYNFYYAKMAAAAIAAVLIFIGLKKKNFKTALIGPILLVAITFLGAFAEVGVQNFIVSPNELSKEEAYINDSITYTQKAYSLDQVERLSFPATTDLTASDVADAEETIRNIRINDFRPTQAIYNQLQSIRLYYQFNNISIDRYDLDGDQRQVFLSAREMDITRLPSQAQNWINQHLKFTHGYGAAVSPVNEVTSQGQPRLIVKDIPPQSEYPELEITRPEIYFGTLTDNYVITNTSEMEFNYPMEDQNAETTYSGDAGIPLHFINRIAFSIDQKTSRILLSGALNSESKIITNRNVTQRVEKIAPFLTVESEPYLVINEGKLYWMTEGYTTSNRYPYSQPVNFKGSRFNYIRNSVKVVVDAYNGSTTFYIADPEDPMINTYSSIYPELFQDINDMPENLRSHIKYPVELFDIQANIFSNYHMTDPRVFFNREDAWSIATEKYHDDLIPIRPYYLNMILPGNDEVEFILVQPYTAFQKNNMVSWLAARNDGENYGELVVYTFPRQRLVYGPMQIESRIDQDGDISTQLTLWGQQGSSVLRGNLMVIPIKDSLLYVEPLYLQSDNANALPEVRRIILAYGDEIVMAPTMAEGLRMIFGEESVQDENGEEIITDDRDPIISSDMNELIQKANQLYQSSQAKLRQGDWTGYGNDMEELEDILERLGNLQ